MMNELEREEALKRMQAVSDMFYLKTIHIGNHPFIEFCGLMNEYIHCCEEAHQQGIDFTECNTHSGQHLPMKPHHIRYVNEKLECIFTGRSVLQEQEKK